jgi:hypothetical protein
LFESTNGDFDIQKKHLNNKGEIVISSGETNMGVIGKSNVPAKIFDKNTITIDMFGSSYFRNYKYKMVTHARVFSLTFKYKINEAIGLYLLGLMRFIKKMFSYNNMCNWQKVKELMIDLPITETGAINFKFMEKYTRELELARARELETYLKVTGLSDYKLTAFEKKLLNEYGSGCIKTKMFKLGDLFDVNSNPQLDKKHFKFQKNSKYPYFTRTIFNNGILGYVDYLDEKHLIKGGCLAIGMMGMKFFYFNTDFYSGQFTKHIRPKNFEFNKEIAIYFISILNKLSCMFQGSLVRDFTKMFNNIKVTLPITETGKIDFDYMEQFIKIQQKLAIKNVVKWRDEQIKITKKAIK